MKPIVYMIGIITLFLFIPASPAIAGTVSAPDTTYYSFTYDNSGNRTRREIDLTKSAVIHNGQDSSEKVIEETVKDFPIKIFPNPTKGIIKVNIPGLGDEVAVLVVYNIHGKQVFDIKLSDTASEINLNDQPPGIYFLRIIIGGTSTEWKVIKD